MLKACEELKSILDNDDYNFVIFPTTVSIFKFAFFKLLYQPKKPLNLDEVSTRL